MQSHRLRTIAGAAIAVSSLLAGTAKAEIIQWSYSGTVGYGYDHARLFGDDPDLTGRAFSMVERFDTARSAFRYVDDAQSLQFGGSQRGASASASLLITIGGVGRTILDLEDYIYSGSVTGKHLDFVKDSLGYEYAGFYVQSPMLPADYASTLTLDATQALFIGNYQFFSRTDPALATYASFDVATLSVTTMPAVPLPGSAALFGTSLLVMASGARLVGRRSAADRR